MRDEAVFTSGEPGPSAPSTPSRAPANAITESDTPGLAPGVREIQDMKKELRKRVELLNRGDILTEVIIGQIANSLWYATDDTSIAVAITNISDETDALTDQNELVDVLDVLKRAWASHMKLNKGDINVTLTTDLRNGNQIKVSFKQPLDELLSSFPQDESSRSDLENHIKAFDAKSILGGTPKVSMVALPTNNLTIPMSDFLDELAKRLDPEEPTNIPGDNKGTKSTVKYYKFGIRVANRLFGPNTTEKITDEQIHGEIGRMLENKPKLGNTAKEIIVNWVKKIYQRNVSKD